MTKILSFSEYSSSRKIRVEAPRHLLTEAKRVTVGRYTARRDPPHFSGDEYHAHSEIPGGYEVAWGASGARRHPNKFPSSVPPDAKAAVAKVLGVRVDQLEGYLIDDESIGERVLLIEVRD